MNGLKPPPFVLVALLYFMGPPFVSLKETPNIEMSVPPSLLPILISLIYIKSKTLVKKQKNKKKVLYFFLHISVTLDSGINSNHIGSSIYLLENASKM